MMDDFTAPAKLFVVGSFVIACTVKVTDLPAPGETLAASAFALEPGGKGFNLAVAAKRLGADVGGVLAIGNDALAGLAGPAIEASGLAPSMALTLEGQTGGGVGFIAEDGETCLAVFPGANADLSAAHIAERSSAIAEADLVMAQCEVADAPIAEAFKIARGAGVRTMLNPSPFRSSCIDLFASTSILCLNGVEASRLMQSFNVGDEASLAHAFFDRGGEAVVITAGALGATAYLRDERAPVKQPAFKVRAVDSLGAGDAFASGLATTLAEGNDWPEAMRRAAACGALTASSFGVLDALPRRDAVEALMQTGLDE